jgi:pyruvate dehydrogenase E1 component alpha subunit
MKLNARLKDNITALGTYTWAKSITRLGTFNDWTNFATQKALDTNSVPQSLSLNVIYQTPHLSNGLLGGKGGSMHLTSVEHGMMGSYAIIGAHLTIANGAAWSAQYRGSGQVAVCFFGDGTTNIGAFHEALNYAAVYRLPIVFVCENNLYMEYTSIHDITAVANPAADRASAYGLDPVVLDGNDADEVYLAARTALDRARSGQGPSLVEAITYRHGGHSRADPGKYRPADEVEAWKAYDPLTVYRERLLRLGVAADRLDEIDAAALALVDTATEEAIAGELPAPESAFTDVWADGGWTWRN